MPLALADLRVPLDYALFHLLNQDGGAWLDGAGILPLPLKPEPVGRLPDARLRRADFG